VVVPPGGDHRHDRGNRLPLVVAIHRHHGRWDDPDRGAAASASPRRRLTAAVAGYRSLPRLGLIGYGFGLVCVLPLVAAVVDGQGQVAPTPDSPCSHQPNAQQKSGSPTLGPASCPTAPNSWVARRSAAGLPLPHGVWEGRCPSGHWPGPAREVPFRPPTALAAGAAFAFLGSCRRPRRRAGWRPRRRAGGTAPPRCRRRTGRRHRKRHVQALGFGVVGQPLQSLPHDLGLAAPQGPPLRPVEPDELDAHLERCIFPVAAGGGAALGQGDGTVA
jgi:hypothetical protein